MLRTPPALAVVIAVHALASCNQADPAPRSSRMVAEKPAPRPLRPAPTIAWEGSRAALTGAPGDYQRMAPELTVRLEVDDRGFVALVNAGGLPDGSTVRAGDATVPVTGPHGTARLAIPIAGAAGMIIAELDRPTQLTAPPVEIAIPGHATATTTLPAEPLQVKRRDVERLFRTALQRPLALADAATPLDTAAVAHAKSLDVSFVGGGRTLADVDWLVDVTHHDTGQRRSCDGYLGHTAPIVFALVESVIQIRDLRTGAVVREGARKPSGRCPSTTVVTNGTPELRVSADEVDRWVRDQLARDGARRTR